MYRIWFCWFYKRIVLMFHDYELWVNTCSFKFYVSKMLDYINYPNFHCLIRVFSTVRQFPKLANGMTSGVATSGNLFVQVCPVSYAYQTKRYMISYMSIVNIKCLYSKLVSLPYIHVFSEQGSLQQVRPSGNRCV